MKSYEELSRLLWRQRRLVETLLYKLEVERLLLATGRTRWLDAATVEVNAVLDQIQYEEVVREALPLATIRRELVLPVDAPLSRIITAAPDPWGDIYRDHQRTLLSFLAEIDQAGACDRELLQRGLRATHAFILSLDTAPATDA